MVESEYKPGGRGSKRWYSLAGAHKITREGRKGGNCSLLKDLLKRRKGGWALVELVSQVVICTVYVKTDDTVLLLEPLSLSNTGHKRLQGGFIRNK